MADNDIIKLTKQKETKNICSDCLWKTEQKPGFTTWLLETKVSK